jgi:glycosyltransferase involved in cell wall biosynthesis
VLTGHYFDVLTQAGYPAARIRTVPNSIRLGDEPGDPPERDVPVIGGLGRLVPNKGFDVLLGALARLKAGGVRFRCIVHGVDDAGGTGGFEAMRDQLGFDADEVSFPGWTDEPQAFLRSLDIFCLPSRREVQSLALLEALAAGRPIVCTRVPGLEQVFTDGVEGVFVDIENQAGLADALDELLRDRGRRLAMGRAARRRARAFDIDAVGEKLRAALEELAGP